MSPLPVSPGYHSPDSKRSIKRAMLTGVILIGLLQVIVPVVLIGGAVISAIFGVFTSPNPDFGAPAVHDGYVYYTTKALVNGEDTEADTPRSLVRVPLDRDGAPEVVAEVGSEYSEPKLVAADGAIHLIETDRVTTVRDAASSVTELEDGIPYKHWALVHEGRPAVVSLEHSYADDADTVDLRTWDGSRWNVVWTALSEVPADADEVRAVAIGSVVHVFVSGSDEPIVHAEFTAGGLSPWKPTKIVADDWTVVAQGSVPIVLQLDDRDETTKLVAWRERTGWRSFFSDSVEASDVGAVSLSDGRFAVVTDQLFDGVSVKQFDESSVVVSREHSASTIWEETIGLIVASQLAPFVLTGLLALILSGRMQTHRVTEYRVDHRVARYASLTRRGIARAVDTVLVAALPLAVIMPQALDGGLDETAVAALAFGLSLPALGRRDLQLAVADLAISSESALATPKNNAAIRTFEKPAASASANAHFLLLEAIEVARVGARSAAAALSGGVARLEIAHRSVGTGLRRGPVLTVVRRGATKVAAGVG